MSKSLEYLQESNRILEEAAVILGCKPHQVLNKYRELRQKAEAGNKKLEELREALAS